MSETPRREWRFYIRDMITFADKVASYTENFDQHAFISDNRTYDATLRNLELLGEAATHIPQTVRDRYPTIPWRQIVATRNCLIHAYLGIDNDTLWSIIRDDIPALQSALSEIALELLMAPDSI